MINTYDDDVDVVAIVIIKLLMFVRSHLLVTSLCVAIAAVVWYNWSTLTSFTNIQ